MSTTTLTTPVTLSPSFSFYVQAKREMIAAAALASDAACVRGIEGPTVVEQMRTTGWSRTALFDGAAYEQKVDRISDARWFEMQLDAGADRLLTQGSWIPWDPIGGAMREGIEREVKACAESPGSTVVLAIDNHWLTRGIRTLISELTTIENPIALVLAHAGDPLSASGAVDALLALAKRFPSLSILRSDHGSIGAVAFGAIHASIGLTTTYRHFVPIGTRAGGRPGDRTSRLFLWDLMDWFTVATIAGWGATGVSLRCYFDCCGGAELLRFFDPLLDEAASNHNRTVLGALAEDILNAPVDDRPRRFASRCADAVALYGPMGKFSNTIEPKDQLVQWASYV